MSNDGSILCPPLISVNFRQARGRGVQGARKGGVGFFTENPRRGAGSLQGEEGGGASGRGVCGELGGGRAKYFLRGPKFPPSLRLNFRSLKIGSEKGVFWKRGLFVLEIFEILEILKKPQTLENKEESDHFLEILENLEILETLEIPPVKRPLS